MNKMFQIFGYLFFFIIIYFIIQKNNSQEKFDDMPPLPGGTWTKYCQTSGSNFSWTKDDLGNYTLRTTCKKIPTSWQVYKTITNLKNDDYISNNLDFDLIGKLKLVPK